MTFRRLQLSPRARALAPVAVLCLLLQVVGMAHLLLVRHSVCATHGEVIEVGARDREQLDVEHDHGAGATATVEVGHPTAADQHDDHCGWMSDRRDHRTSIAPLSAPTEAVFVEAFAPPRLTPSAARALYRLAPKVSPPLLA